MSKAVQLATPQVVGTVHSTGALRHAIRLKPGAVDLLELRVDHFATDLQPLRAALPKLRFPCIVTVRHPQEGGANGLSVKRRLELYQEFLPHAALVDVELRSVERLATVFQEASESGIVTVASHHFFRHTPGGTALSEKLKEARVAGADVFKIAARTASPSDVARLLELLGARKQSAASVMGMGPLGKASRLLFARAGSCLNYGYLGEPQVSGQWPAELLKKRLEEVLAER